MMGVMRRLFRFEGIKKWLNSEVKSRYHVMMNYVNYYKKEFLYEVDLRNGKESKERIWYFRLPLQYIAGFLMSFDDYYDRQIGKKRGIIGWLVYLGWYIRGWIGFILDRTFVTDKYRILHAHHDIADEIIDWQNHIIFPEIDKETGETKYFFEWVDEDTYEVMFEEVPDPEKYWEDYHLGKLPDEEYQKYDRIYCRFVV